MSVEYSLEQSLETAVVDVLSAAIELEACRIVPADQSDEETLPQISVRAEKLDEVVLGMQTWNARIGIKLSTVADLTPAEEIDERFIPDNTQNDAGAAGFKLLYKDLVALLESAQFITNLNAENIVKVWGIEFEPVSYENETRSFARTINLRVWANEAFATIEP
jgi:hypothetical protein